MDILFQQKESKLEQILLGINGILFHFQPLIGLPLSISSVICSFKNQEKVSVSFVRLFNLFAGIIGIILSVNAGIKIMHPIIGITKALSMVVK